MSFLFGKPQVPVVDPKIGGLDHENVNTNEQARPLPWFSGIARFPLTWLGPAYNVRTQAVTSKVGKKKTTTSYEYYAGVAGLVCAGPVDKITEIWMDREQVWTGSVTRGATDYADITVTGRGQFRIYWGTDTQTQDTLLLSGSGDAHPPYRNQCYVVCPDLYWGNNAQTAPSIEVVVARSFQPSWGSEPAAIDDDANPAYAVAELLQNNIFGLGFADERIATASFETIANKFDTDVFGVSPYIDKQMTFRDVMKMFNEHCDIYLTPDSTGKYQLEKPEPYASVFALDQFTDSEIKEAPTVSFKGWDSVITTTWLRYKNRDNAFKEDAVVYRDQGAQQILNNFKAQTIQRPWITQNDIAEIVASKTGRLAAIPTYTGSFQLIDTEAENLNLGEIFRFNWDELGFTNFIGVCESKTIPKPGDRFWTITFAAWHNVAYSDNAEAIGVVTPPTLTTLSVVDLHSKFVTELPYKLALQSSITFAPLLSRGDSLTTAANIWLEQGTNSYDKIGTVEGFGKKGKLTSSFSKFTDVHITGSTSLNVELQSPENTLESVTDAAAQNNNLLLFINPGQTDEEIISISSVNLISGTTYEIFGYRSRYDTRRQTHSINEPAFIIERAQLEQIFDDEIIETGQNYDIKFQPVLNDQEFDLASITEITTPVAVGRQNQVQAPKNLAMNGNQSGDTFGSTDDIVVTWDDPDGWLLTDDVKLDFYDENENTIYHTQIITSGNSFTFLSANINSSYSGFPGAVVCYAYGKRSGSFSIKFDVCKSTFTT